MALSAVSKTKNQKKKKKKKIIQFYTYSVSLFHIVRRFNPAHLRKQILKKLN